MAQKILHIFLWLGAVFFGAGVILFFHQHKCFAQTSYYGPTSPVAGTVSIEIHIYDAPELGGATIQSVSFGGQQIALKPAGLHGLRGGGGFKKIPGSYDLIWTVSRSTTNWPRTIQKQQKIAVKETDTWIQIEIHGETLEIL